MSAKHKDAMPSFDHVPPRGREAARRLWAAALGEKHPADMSFREYKAWREAQEKTRTVSTSGDAAHR